MKESESKEQLESIKNKLEKHFQDRIIARENNFKEVGVKKSGITEGYPAKNIKTENDIPEFMIKKVGSETDLFLNEYVTSPLYERILYDRTPIISGLIENDNLQITGLKSKYLSEFQTIAEFTDSKLPNKIGIDNIKLADVEGAEKLFAAILFVGEYDIHAGNIGVMKVKGEDESDKYVFAKIDHGWSASNFFTSSHMMMQNFYKAYSIYGYKNNINLDLNKFKESIDQILTISNREIKTIIRARIYQLNQLGFDFKNRSLPYWENDPFHDIVKKHAKKCQINDKGSHYTGIKYYIERTENYYIDHFNSQKKTMQKLSNNLASIKKIGDPEWHKGKWFIDMKGEEAVTWAVKNKKPIENVDPLIWAINNKKPIEGEDPIKWVENKKPDLTFTQKLVIAEARSKLQNNVSIGRK